MTTSIPTDTVWGVQWELVAPPEGELPDQPVAPAINAEPDKWAEYADRSAQWQAAVIELVGMHEEWWQTTVSVAVDEDTARQTYADLVAAQATNPFTRNITLVSTPPRVWTPVE